ncbi:hypothetical protein DQ04_05141020 [Trypanosoma grayi]|uniref:hypothetical protein n=1 Tax=Trypanosoma grayi TaxID=71804 RepID=UPI0004F4629C|nr:hypothetical protein DQ04_05141020 [Trypanosoma grayi]KEG09483.1 hypothetical protein DQ04_05141020 [Trypanosoma grayi]
MHRVTRPHLLPSAAAQAVMPTAAGSSDVDETGGARTGIPQQSSSSHCAAAAAAVAASLPPVLLGDDNMPRVPLERTEVLFALGTGDVRAWEERLLRHALAGLKDPSATVTQAEGESKSGSVASARTHLTTEMASFPSCIRHKQHQGQREGDTNTSSSSSICPSGWLPVALLGAPVARGSAMNVDFSLLSGKEFYLLMELMKLTTTTSEPGRSTAPPSASPMCWNDELLQVLSCLLTFHGTVPAVGRFVSLLLCSCVMELLRRQRAVVDRDCAPAATHARGREMNAAEKNEQRAHLAFLRRGAFAALLSRLGQLYFPLWRAFREEGAEKRLGFSLYTRCVPLPTSLCDALTVFSSNRGRVGGSTTTTTTTSNSNSSGRNEQESSRGRTLRAKVMELVFNQTNTLKAGVGLSATSSSPNSRGNNDAAERTGDASEMMSTQGDLDVPLRWEHVQEIAVCIALAELGRLALLHNGWDETQPFDGCHDPQQQKGQPDVKNEGSGSYVEFLRRTRYCGGCSTSARMNTSAKILLTAGEEWKGLFSDDGSVTGTSSETTTPQRQESCGDNEGNNYLWIARAVQDVLEVVCCASGGVLLPPSEPEQRDCSWLYAQQDFCYINLLLTCCCIAGVRLPASILPFTAQLTQLALSHAVVKGDPESEEVAFSCVGGSSAVSSGHTTEKTGGGHVKVEGASDDGNEARTVATGTLCMTACKFLRLGYQRGCVVSNNEHIRWLAAVLQKQIQLWERCLRHITLFMTLTRAESATRCGGSERLTLKEAAVHSEWQQQLQKRLWRALCWHTRTLLECLFVFRDLFRFAATWSVVNDTAPFRAVLQELGEVLQMVCWIDANGRDDIAPVAAASSALLLTPFPVMVDVGRRFYLGAMLVFVVSATTDTLLWYQNWLDEREAFFSDGDEADDGNIRFTENRNTMGGAGDPSASLADMECCPSGTAAVDAFTSVQGWLYDVFLLVLLPSCGRVLQSIALCAPLEAMLPAVLSVHNFVKSNSLLHLAMAGREGEACQSNTNSNSSGTSRMDGTAHPLMPSCALTAFSETLTVAMEVMAVATDVQRVVLHRVSLVTPAENDVGDNETHRWILHRGEAALRVMEHLVLWAPWAAWAPTPPRHPNTVTLPKSGCCCSTSTGKTHRECNPSSSSEASSGSADASMLHAHAVIGVTHRDHAPAPAPPPLFQVAYVANVAYGLLRTWKRHSSSVRRSGALLERVQEVLFGVVSSLFRAADAAVYQRSLLCEQLRRQQQKQQQPQREGSVSADTLLPTSSGSLFQFPPFLSDLLASSWPFSSGESDAERAEKARLAVVEPYVYYHCRHICDSVTYMACVLGLLQQELLRHRERDAVAAPAAAAADGAASRCGAALQLLGHQALESLLPDAAVPATFHLAPLPVLPPNHTIDGPASVFALLRKESREMAGSGAAESMPFLQRLLFTLTASQQQQDRYVQPVREWVGPPPLELVVQQASALVRVMSAIAALTQAASHGAKRDALRGICTPAAAVAQDDAPSASVSAVAAAATDNITITGASASVACAPYFLLHPATLSFSHWRKLNFALRVMQYAEANRSDFAPLVCALCGAHGSQRAFVSGELERDEYNVNPTCFACCTSIECWRCLETYVEAALPDVNSTRLDVLICRQTSAAERRALFVVLLVIRRACRSWCALQRTRVQAALTSPEADEEQQQQQQQYTHLLRWSLRGLERSVLRTIAAFAFGVRPLRSAAELMLQ